MESIFNLVEAVEGHDESYRSDDSSDYVSADSEDGAADKTFSKEKYPLKVMTEVVNHWLNKEGRKRRSLSSVQNRFRFVTLTTQLHRYV